MSKRDAVLLLEDNIHSAKKILLFTEGIYFDQFIKDDKTIDEVIRNFQVIGEAANRLPFTHPYPPAHHIACVPPPHYAKHGNPGTSYLSMHLIFLKSPRIGTNLSF